MHSIFYRPFYTGLFEASYSEVTDCTFPSNTDNDPSDTSIDLTASSHQSSSPSIQATYLTPQRSLLPSMTSHLIQKQYYEVRPEELTSSPDVTECEQFYQQTCGCDKDHGNPCSKQFTLEHYIQ